MLGPKTQLDDDWINDDDDYVLVPHENHDDGPDDDDDDEDDDFPFAEAEDRLSLRPEDLTCPRRISASAKARLFRLE